MVNGASKAFTDGSSAFKKVQDSELYQDALEGVTDLASSPLLMSFGFISSFDPWSENGALKMVMSAIVEIFQTIVGFFLFGCDVFDDSCAGELPSVRNNVLPIKETRNGSIHMTSGCDSEFEGELAWYKPAFDIIDNLLQAAGDAVIEFINIPIKIIQFILQAASQLFMHMNDVCGYLDSYVELALVEATFENSRFALQELACREPATLKRGHGCDGIDNTCDPDKQIDECGEDVIPPEIDASEAVSLCNQKIFTSADDALECFDTPGLVTATDDCMEVELSFSKTDAVDGCSTTVHINAEALGCGKRPEEDTTVLNVEVSIDEDPPEVECNLLAQNLTGTGAGNFTDLGFSFSAVDGGSVGCTATEDLAISIKVYSNEVVETGEEVRSRRS